MTLGSKLTTFVLGAALSVLSLVATASPAAAVTADEKLAVISSWTQTSTASYGGWYDGRTHQSHWTAYGFDWSTDYCSSSPDNPLGFDFALSCARHDFGYRNYKAVGQFPANKAHVDSSLYADLKRKCGSYIVLVRPACYSLAWTYYQAVKTFGKVVVDRADIDRAAALLPADTRR